MILAWTTVATLPEAERLASESIARGLAVCAQVEGSVTSFYLWEGRQERSTEFRILFKCLPENRKKLESNVLSHHPYAVPEWIEVEADRVSEKYLSWAKSLPTH